MRKLLKRLEALFAAVAFAEEGEVEAARQLADDGADAPADAGVRREKAREPVRRGGMVHQGKIARLP